MKLSLKPITTFLRSTTASLAGSYLLIIMLMSIGFSLIFYHTSLHELNRQLPPPIIRQSIDAEQSQNPAAAGTSNPLTNDHRFDSFFEQRIKEGRQALMQKLIIVNASALVCGSIVSYGLARRTLRPIEANMAAQTQFVSDASHELRTPLTTLRATNEVALRRDKLRLPDAQQILRQNIEEVARLQELSDGLLRLARQDVEPLARSSVSLQEVAADAMNHIIRPAQAKQISFEDTTPAIAVMANKQALVQALDVLLDNAVKYSPPHSTVTIGGYQKTRHGYLTVTDAGIGIADSDVPHIFRRFYRADQARSAAGQEATGYGIGLSIAQKIIEHLDGKMTVVSELGKGSTFTIKIPLAKSA